LLGAALIRAAAQLLPAAELWIVRAAALVAMIAGLVVTARVFAFHQAPHAAHACISPPG
jgi:hypothetical protein